MIRTLMPGLVLVLLCASGALPGPTAAQEPDSFVGTFVGQHWSGPFILEVRRSGDSYEMRHSAHGMTSAPVRMTIDEAGDLYGTVMRERYWIRRTGDGFRYRARGFDVAVEKHHVSDGSALAERWVGELSGVKLIQMSSSYDSSSGSRSRTEIQLCAGGRFAMEYESSFRASTGGVSASSRNADSDTGLWRVLTHDGMPVLELRSIKGEVVYVVPSVRGAEFYLGDERTFVEPNAICG